MIDDDGDPIARSGVSFTVQVRESRDNGRSFERTTISKETGPDGGTQLTFRFTDPSQHERLRARARWELEKLREGIHLSTGDGPADDGGSTVEEVLGRVGSRISELEALYLEGGPCESVAMQELSMAIDDWDGFVRKCLGSLPVTDKVAEMTRLMVCTSLRVASGLPGWSGIVIAGFGTAQLFPALSHYLVDGVIAGLVRARRLSTVQIGWDQTAAICPFAQQDMMQTFMDGLYPGYRRALRQFVDETIKLFANHFGDQVKSSLSSEEYAGLTDGMDLVRQQTAEHFDRQLDGLLEEANSDRIMSVVGMLPKEELAEMAEALVNLTSLKRRVTPEDETVGGPVDVAVISKGDGLVWIKRKHYFAPELNPRYFERDRTLLTAAGQEAHDESEDRGRNPSSAGGEEATSGSHGLHPG